MRALSDLRSLQQKAERYGYRGRIQIGKFPNHEKILVVDDDFVVCGSNNWLSNTGFRNSERSVVVRSPDFARVERERVSKLVSEHPVQ
jgi:phosphatidylserine/phosphatidylglycerophosphate/cardiolipin synthase-like enzyme